MIEESQIVSQISEKIPSEQGFHDFKLLRTTAFAHLYIAHKQGKRFLIKTTKDNTKQQLAMLRREYELSICATHPHIVHTYTYITDLEVGEGIIMEYIESRTLAEYLTENPPKSERNRIEQEKELEREKQMQTAIIDIKKKFGKNAILKGMNFEDGATAKDRNSQIGGHKA